MLDFNIDGLKALHRVLIKARFRAYQGESSQVLASLLDDAEYLIDSLLSEEDRTEEFVGYLRGMGERFPDLSGLSKAFEARTM